MNKLRKIAASIGVIFVAFSSLLFTSPAAAESVSGLNVEVYSFDSSFLPDRVPYTICEGAWTHVDNIDSDFDNQFEGVVAGCQQEFTLIHYTGSVTFPESGEYSFLALADDGFWLSLDGLPIITEDWVLKGRSGNTYSGIQIEGGHTYALDAWFYEYGGGANVTLYYAAPGKAFEIVPAEFFTTDGSTPVIVNPPFLNPPLDVNAVATGTDVKVTWKAPIDSGTAVEHYALMWTYDGQPGWGVGVWGNEYTITNLPENKEVTFSVRADNDTLAVYSAYSLPALATTTTTVVVPPVDPEPPVDPPVVDPPVDPVVEPEPPVEKPVVDPEPVVEPPVVPEPEPEKPVESIEPPVEEPSTVLSNIMETPAEELTDAQVEQLVEAAMETFNTAEEGSPEYEQAIEALAVAAEADDPEVPEALAAIPLLGDAAAAVLNVFNDIGNLGADMSPKNREKAEKTIIASVIAAQAAIGAVSTATSAATAAAGQTSSVRKNQ